MKTLEKSPIEQRYFDICLNSLILSSCLSATAANSFSWCVAAKDEFEVVVRMIIGRDCDDGGKSEAFGKDIDDIDGLLRTAIGWSSWTTVLKFDFKRLLWFFNPPTDNYLRLIIFMTKLSHLKIGVYLAPAFQL
jgi:hypothetical protein